MNLTFLKLTKRSHSMWINMPTFSRCIYWFRHCLQLNLKRLNHQMCSVDNVGKYECFMESSDNDEFVSKTVAIPFAVHIPRFRFLLLYWFAYQMQILLCNFHLIFSWKDWIVTFNTTHFYGLGMDGVWTFLIMELQLPKLRLVIVDMILTIFSWFKLIVMRALLFFQFFFVWLFRFLFLKSENIIIYYR